MHTYAMPLKDVLELPLRAFWMLHRNVNRIAAEKDQRNIAVVGHSMAGGDGLDKLVDHLRDEIGTVFEMEASVTPSGEPANPVLNMEFDAEGLAALKGMGSF